MGVTVIIRVIILGSKVTVQEKVGWLEPASDSLAVPGPTRVPVLKVRAGASKLLLSELCPTSSATVSFPTGSLCWHSLRGTPRPSLASLLLSALSLDVALFSTVPAVDLLSRSMGSVAGGLVLLL